jgi:hypothetical protein
MSTVKQLEIPPAATRDKAGFEVLRVWIAEKGQHVSIRSGAWEDPFAWGIVLADLARCSTPAPTPRPSSNACSKASTPRSKTPPTNPKAKSPNKQQAVQNRQANGLYSDPPLPA